MRWMKPSSMYRSKTCICSRRTMSPLTGALQRSWGPAVRSWNNDWRSGPAAVRVARPHWDGVVVTTGSLVRHVSAPLAV